MKYIKQGLSRSPGIIGSVGAPCVVNGIHKKGAVLMGSRQLGACMYLGVNIQNLNFKLARIDLLLASYK